MFELFKPTENPVDPFVRLNARDAQHAQLVGDRPWPKCIRRGETTHARNVGANVELTAALGAQILAGHNGVAAAAQAETSHCIEDAPCDSTLEAEFRSILEEAWRVMHQTVEASHSRERCMQGRLIAGHQRLRRVTLRSEVSTQCRNFFRRTHLRAQLDDL